jgi:hypothetical protein
MRNIIKYFKGIIYKPLFNLLFPVFFVFHGFTVYYDSVPVGEALWLTVQYIGISILITCLLWLLYRDIKKASVATLLIMAFHFFFGNFLDFLKDHFLKSFSIQVYDPFLHFYFPVAVYMVKEKKKMPVHIYFLFECSAGHFNNCRCRFADH